MSIMSYYIIIIILFFVLKCYDITPFVYFEILYRKAIRMLFVNYSFILIAVYDCGPTTIP